MIVSMASITQRGSSYQVKWTFQGKQQSCTFPDRLLAEKAQMLVKLRDSKIDKFHVYHEITGVPLPVEPVLTRSRPLVSDWAEVWLEMKIQASSTTRGRYRTHLDDVILPILGHLRLNEVTGQDALNVIRFLQRCDCAEQGAWCASARNTAHGRDNATVDRYFSTMYSMFKAAVRQKKIESNPCEDVWTRSQPMEDDDSADDTHRVYLTESQYARIRSFLDEDSRRLTDFLVATGARWSEATAAQVKAIGARKGVPHLSIFRAWKFRPPSERSENESSPWFIGTTKGRVNRSFEVGPELVNLVEPCRAGAAPDDLLFRAPKGGRIFHSNFVNRKWDPAVIAAMRCSTHPPAPRGVSTADSDLAGPTCGDNGGVRNDGEACGALVVEGINRCRTHAGPAPDAVSSCNCPDVLKETPTLHDLRHTCASWLLDAGVPVSAVSQILGHRSTEVTELIYGGLMPLSKAEAAKVIAARMTWA